MYTDRLKAISVVTPPLTDCKLEFFTVAEDTIHYCRKSVWRDYAEKEKSAPFKSVALPSVY